ncbi:hypothetical protein POSPLADRAFT_1042338 [Postia placenta MAD-698-R-SB12]|uniref:Uncharacterized protein n=1 Tax=Postia placenta MAD-698-R-SB12 TaxID=670580 RepID=A0A1X6NEW2_9APHY|nr:hypothetical protein POSPLADRAFT_1042338 [Postia placenta MAD-698-R-SB12]OSX67060.1 hypothetical protein POSPLADRAFT_1042338 [Postia placenta MAD-698-R-SB12]
MYDEVKEIELASLVRYRHALKASSAFKNEMVEGTGGSIPHAANITSENMMRISAQTWKNVWNSIVSKCDPGIGVTDKGSADSSSANPSPLDWLISMTDSYQMTVLLLENANIPLCNNVPTSRRDLFPNRRRLQRTMTKAAMAPMITIASPVTSPATHVRFLVDIFPSALDVADAEEPELVLRNVVLLEDDTAVEEADGVPDELCPGRQESMQLMTSHAETDLHYVPTGRSTVQSSRITRFVVSIGRCPEMLWGL